MGTELMTAAERFELVQREAKALTQSNLVPKEYRGDSPEARANCMVAQDLANRTGMPTLMVMQNLHVIEGRPSWASNFIIAAINSCGIFTPLRFRMVRGEPFINYKVETTYKDKKTGERKTSVKTFDKVPNLSCTAWAKDKETGEIVEGTTITTEMALQEGWFSKPGSKWLTMPEQMIQYRAASFFGRLYCPQILCGIHSADEVEDFTIPTVETPKPEVNIQDRLDPKPDPKPEAADAELVEGELPLDQPE